MDQAVTFRDLRPSDAQVAVALEDRVRQSALTWFPDRAETNGPGRRLIIGVAVWSVYDLRLLQLLNDAVAGGARPDLHVAVFNIDSSPTDLQRLFPGIGEVYQPPVVGYWEAGQLKESGFGFAARQLVGRLLGFDPNLVLQQSAQVAG
jgi:hypothetical protein